MAMSMAMVMILFLRLSDVGTDLQFHQTSFFAFAHKVGERVEKSAMQKTTKRGESVQQLMKWGFLSCCVRRKKKRRWPPHTFWHEVKSPSKVGILPIL